MGLLRLHDTRDEGVDARFQEDKHIPWERGTSLADAVAAEAFTPSPAASMRAATVA